MAKKQGFLYHLVLGGNIFTDVVVSSPLSRTKAVLNKATQDGTGAMQSIPGMESGTLQVSGFVDQPQYNTLEGLWSLDDPVDFKLSIAEGLGGQDSEWDGFLTLSSLEVSPSVDGAWEFSLSGDITGPVVYTPSDNVPQP